MAQSQTYSGFVFIFEPYEAEQETRGRAAEVMAKAKGDSMVKEDAHQIAPDSWTR